MDNYREHIRVYKSYKELYDTIVGATHGAPKLPNIDVFQFRYLLKDMEAKGLIYISSDLEDVEGHVYTVTYQITEDSDDSLPRVKVTEFGLAFLKFIEKFDID